MPGDQIFGENEKLDLHQKDAKSVKHMWRQLVGAGKLEVVK